MGGRQAPTNGARGSARGRIAGGYAVGPNGPHATLRDVEKNAFNRLLSGTLAVLAALLLTALAGSYYVAPDGALWPEVDLGGPLPRLRSGGDAGSAWAEVARVLAPSVAYIVAFDEENQRRSSGSGVVVRSDGYLVTNWHVVDGATRVEVQLSEERSYEATLVGRDDGTDLAVLRVDADGALAAAALGDSESLEVGQWVVAMGAPFQLRGTVSTGIVSALNRRVRSLSTRSTFVQTDAAINPGNSGGPLANLRGEVIGINTAIAVSEAAQRAGQGTYAGVGFAIPINTVRLVASRLIGRATMTEGGATATADIPSPL